MMRRKLSVLLILCLFATAFAGCGGGTATAPGGGAAPDDQAITLNLGHVLNTESPFHAGAIYFADLVYERSGGMLQVEVFPSALLGNDRELAEGLQGLVDQPRLLALPPQAGD